MSQETTRLVRAFLIEHQDEVSVKDIDLSIFLLAHIVESTVHAAVLLNPEALASGALGRELEKLLMAYLTLNLDCAS